MTQERHNALVTDISRHLSEKGYVVKTERQFQTPLGGRRPDIICSDRTRKRVFILDVTCPFETDENPLKEAAANKTSYYNIPELFTKVREVLEVPPDTVAESHGLVFGARGGLAAETYKVLESLGVSKKKLNLWCELTIFRTLMVYQHYQRSHKWHRTKQCMLGEPRSRIIRYLREPLP